MIRTDKAHLSTVALTHPGMSGKNNEDRFAVSAYQLSSRDHTPVLLAVLADGIGGHQAGEVAAELAVNLVSQRIATSDGRLPTLVMRQAMLDASNEILSLSQADSAYKGMGATCAVIWIIGYQLYTATVGDTRVYLIHDKQIKQLSKDHTWVQEALDAGVLKPEDAKKHRNAHVIRRYLGSVTPPEIDLRLILSDSESSQQSESNQGYHLNYSDRLLLCSDGLTDLVTDQEIMNAFEQYPAEAAAQSLIDLANQRGGHDNITVISIQIPERKPEVRSKPRWKYLGWGCMAALGLSLVIAALVLGYFLFWRGEGQGGSVSPTPTVLVTQTPLPSIPGETQASPSPTLQEIPTFTPTRTVPLPAPLENGATLTPWPTNTLPFVPTSIPTSTLVP